jgi:hypothetical protein
MRYVTVVSDALAESRGTTTGPLCPIADPLPDTPEHRPAGRYGHGGVDESSVFVTVTMPERSARKVALGAHARRPEVAMNEFTTVTLVGQRVEDVFAVIQDVARTPVWSPGLREPRRTSKAPLKPGAGDNRLNR